MTISTDPLRLALRHFVDDAFSARADFMRDGVVVKLIPGLEEFATQLAKLPSAAEADSLAVGVATANGYLVREVREGVERRPAGRALSARALIETGLAGALLANERLDADLLVAELSAYLAGPAVPVWDYAITDAAASITTPVPVVDGWELATPSADELAALVGVPSSARHVGVDRLTLKFDLDGGLAMLRRVDPVGKPHSGFVLYWNFRPAHSLWQPLLALSLFQNAVVHLWAQYDVEPGRRVDLLFDRVYTEPWSPDGETEVEVVRRGDFEIDEGNEPRLRRFLERVAALLDTALAQPTRPTNASKERAARLRRIAEHFLTAGEDAHGEGDVLSEFNADAVLHYVIALEAVLAGGESDKSELTRKVVQRAAMLAGADDADRREVADLVLGAYRARSAYAHGSEPDEIDVPSLRRVVRDCILARLILGDPTQTGSTLSQLADLSLIDHELLSEQVRRPIHEFRAGVNASLA